MSTKIGTAATYLDLLTILDAFLTATGHAWGLRFIGTGNGRMRGLGGTVGGYLGGADSVTETFTVTFTSATSANVVGSVSGSIGTATVGTDFTSTKLNFRLVAGGTAFVSGDYFTINTGPKWVRHRFGGSPETILRTGTFSNTAALFDNVTTSSTVTATGLPQSVTVQMGVATKVRSFAIWGSATTTQSPRNFNLEWSDNGTTWTTAQSWSTITWAQVYERKDFVLSADPGAHLYWRLNITAVASGTTVGVTELRLFSDTAGKVDVSRRMEFAWKAPGVDGTKEIWVAGYTVTDNGTDLFNLAFRGYRFWQDTELSVIDVPDNSGNKVLPLAKSPIAYWIVVNGGRVIIGARISGIYQYAYVGFGLPYETPSEHPFPYIVSGTTTETTYRWDATGSTQLRNPSDPMLGGTFGSVAAIFPSGIFEQVANRQGSGSSQDGAPVASTYGKVWPHSIDETGGVLNFLRDNIDGSIPLLPCVIHYPGSPQHVWGEFDGIYWTTGFSNTAEALLRDGAIDVMVMTNVYRTGLNHFSAIALD